MVQLILQFNSLRLLPTENLHKTVAMCLKTKKFLRECLGDYYEDGNGYCFVGIRSSQDCKKCFMERFMCVSGYSMKKSDSGVVKS